jgi:hypothetical protein
VDNNPSALPEGRGTDVLSLLRGRLSGEYEVHDPLDLRAIRLSLVPDDRRALLIAETKRTPSCGEHSDLRLLLRQARLPNDSGQGGYLRLLFSGPAYLPQQGRTGPEKRTAQS